MKRKRKHQKLVDDYDTQKRKHLEKLQQKAWRTMKKCVNSSQKI